MSSNVREVRRELEELTRTVKSFNKEQREQLRLLNATTSLLISLGLPKEYNQAISMIRGLIVSGQSLIAILTALQAVSGPLGWLQLIIGAGAFGVSYSATIEMGMRTR